MVKAMDEESIRNTKGIYDFKKSITGLLFTRQQ
mgnify:CR=1 FL=1